MNRAWTAPVLALTLFACGGGPVDSGSNEATGAQAASGTAVCGTTSCTDLAKRRGCFACHAMEKKLIGPAFQDVAVRYEADAKAPQTLLAKVKGGGSGVWGQIPMPPNSHVTDDEASSLVRWVLSQGTAPAPEIPATEGSTTCTPDDGYARCLPLAKSSGCLACHAMDKKLIGPAYRDVAAKYAGVEGAEAKLLVKVEHGGTGTWGQIPMPPNNHVTEDNLRLLVAWVLSQQP